MYASIPALDHLCTEQTAMASQNAWNNLSRGTCMDTIFKFYVQYRQTSSDGDEGDGNLTVPEWVISTRKKKLPIW